MAYFPDINTLVITTVVLGISWHFLQQWLSPKHCQSKALLRGKTVIITGANTGIGKETARDLARRGARVILACRSIERAEAAAKDIQQDSKGEVVVRQLDLSSLKSVRRFAEEIIASESRVDILINNGVGLVCAKATTEDGFDMQFGVNHLGHFLLTYLLLDKIKSSVPARIINVSSRLHYYGKMDWEDLHMEKPNSYTPLKAYEQSKLANVLFTKELARRLKGSGVSTYSLHPGRVRTEITRDFQSGKVSSLSATLFAFMLKWIPYFSLNCVEGAQTTIYCAVTEELKNHNGLYYSDCAAKTPSLEAQDEESAKKLWDVSRKMVGIKKLKKNMKYKRQD